MKRNFGVPTTIHDIIEATILQLSKHALILKNPGIKYADGTPANIVKFRNFTGIEVKEGGLTVSVFPYFYEGSSRPTPESKNASVTFNPYGLMGPDPTRPENGIDLATANLKIRLDLRGYSQMTKPQTQVLEGGQRGLFGTVLGARTFEHSLNEEILRQWTEYIRLALCSDLFNLNGMVKGSQVTWYNFPTTTWDKDGNSILHTAEIMWQVFFNPLREWKPDMMVRGRDPLIGAMQEDGAPVFYRPDHDVLMTGFGVIIHETPSGLPITWDPDRAVLINSTTQEPLSDAALEDPRSKKPFIRLDLLPVGVLTTGDIPLYFNKTSSQLVLYDGTQLDKIPGPDAKLDDDGNLDKTDKSAWIPVAWDVETNGLVYGAAAGERAGKPVTTGDMLDPSTKDFFLITGNAFGLNFETRPRFREFLIFNAKA